MLYQYVSMDRIFTKLTRDVTADFDEGDVIEWTGEALEFMQASRAYEEAIAFMEVRNHQCLIPTGTHGIIQIARNNRWEGPNDIFCPKNISACISSPAKDEPAIPVRIDCRGMPVDAYELAYYRPFFDLKAEYLQWQKSPLYQHFTPVRLASGTSFNELLVDQHCNNYGPDEYKIIQGKVLRFSFREGQVALATLRQLIDPESGYPMIPDNISYTTAIIKYITLMMANRDYQSNREGAKGRKDDADRDWQWYCKQASNVDMMPNGIDEHQNLLEQRQYILPRLGQYYGFFGNLNKAEQRTWNDPDMRNRMGDRYPNINNRIV